MAEDTTNQDNTPSQGTSTGKTNSFAKGMVKDYSEIYIPEGVWTNAINAINTSHKGDEGNIGNEQSNLYCTSSTYSIIGLLHKYKTEWVVFSTNNVNSEIGIFDESNCSYTVLINDPCLNFNTKYLITGAVKYNADCSYSAYWADNNNPDRTMILDIARIPYMCNPIADSCGEETCTNELDCDQLRLHPFVEQPCVTVETSVGAGQLQNGSYQAVVAYSHNGIKLTDYFTPSTPQALWDHSSFGGSLDIFISGLDTNFEEYELVIISNIAQQTVAKKIGNYSVSQTKVHLDQYLESLETIPLSLIPLKSQVYEKSKKMFSLNNYLIRTSVTTQPYFNYQPFANRIRTEWVAVQYPADYYWKGGNKTGYMRDEVYSFFIRWVYKTGARSASFHIPGRSSLPSDLIELSLSNPDLLPGKNKVWQIYDTATAAGLSGTLSDGGVIIAKGNMAYWESTQEYPNNHPEIWGDLCNTPIRHHKMPSNETTHIHDSTGNFINILAVQFNNILHPIDNQGNPLTDISGYEILRGSREGNRTIVAKGLFNNMLEYDIPGATAGTRKGLIQNYPYNDLRPDPFLNSGIKPLNDYFSFNSPEIAFVKPYLGRGVYARIYKEQYGVATGAYEIPYNHPKFKVITDTAFAVGAVFGLGIALLSIMGKTSTTTNNTGHTTLPFVGEIKNTTIPWVTTAAGGSNTLESSHVTRNPLSNFSNSVGMSTEGNAGSAAGNLVGYLAQGISNIGTTGATAGATLATIGNIVTAVTNITTAAFYWYQATQQLIEIIRKLIPYRNYVVQYNSHGFYNSHGNVTNTNLPTGINPSFNRTISSGGLKYIGTGIQDFNATKRINNLFRGKYVCLNLITGATLPDIVGTNADKSKVHVTTGSPFNIKNTDIASYYGALKLDFENQYGQLNSIVQIPTDSCVYPTLAQLNTTDFTEPIFGGDVYVNRYTDKNSYFFFNTWLINEPNGIEFNYQNYFNGPEATYWANFEEYDIRSDFTVGIDWSPPGMDIGTPSDKHHFYGSTQGVSFAVNNSWMYLFNNGVKDFFAESELNMAFRDYGENDWEKFYDVYGTSFNDLQTMFRSDIITKPVFYKYDLSLSTSKLYNNFISWGLLLPPDYDPALYESCYEYFPYRGIYSLQQQDGLKRDNWRNFLPLNYYTFEGVVTNIKAINSSGALILYEDFSPTQFVGVDTLKTETGGTKITIGDGGLFANNIQSLVNAEDVMEYGASISNRATLNTPYGLFFVSQKAGKIIQYGGEGMNEISKSGMKNWFLQNLPSELLEAFPDYTEYDNPVSGIAVQAVFDAQYELLYFTKKDYKPLDCVGYDPNFGFYNSCSPNNNIVSCNEVQGYVYNPVTNKCERTVTSPACAPGYVLVFNSETDLWECQPPADEPVALCEPGWTYDAATNTCSEINTSSATATPVTSCRADIIILISPCPGTNPTIRRKKFINRLIDNIAVGLNSTTGDYRLQVLTMGASSTSQTVKLFSGPGDWQGVPGGTAGYFKSIAYDNATQCNQQNIIYQGLTYAADKLHTAESIIRPLTGSANQLTQPSRTNVRKIIILVTDFPDYLNNGINFTPAFGTCVANNTNDYPVPPATGHYPNSIFFSQAMRTSVNQAKCLIQNLPSLEIFVAADTATRSGETNAQRMTYYTDVRSAGAPYIINDSNAETLADALIDDLVTLPSSTFKPAICSTVNTYTCPSGCTLVGTQCRCMVTQPALLVCDPTCSIVPDGINANCVCSISSVPTQCGTCEVVDGLCSCLEQVTPNITPVLTAISLDDTKFFEKIEWTISYDPKSKMWVSFHDWHPTFMIPSYSHFFTIKDNSFWKHNERFDSFTNYYNINDADITKDYGWEVEYNIVTPNQITTLRSVEYYMEAYKYYNDGKDMFHILDENFNRAIIYNSEQVSPLLSLKIKDKNNPLEVLLYPIVNSVTTEILASKEENKYRFNNFYDITKDRHEYPSATLIVPMFITAPDGYHKSINPNYVNVLKAPTEHKKFRHFGNKIILRKTQSGDKKMLLKLVNSKMLNSPR
jgi:hypothetical protein